MSTTPRTYLAAGVVSLIAASCGTGEDIGVEDPWARPTPPDAESTAVYVEFENNSGQTELLIDGYSPACGRIEIRRTDTVDGVTSMERASAADLRVGDGASLVFEPGGLHLMCLDPNTPLVEGDTISMELTFERSGVVIFDVPVEQR